MTDNIVEFKKEPTLIDQAEEVINFLNDKVDKNFRARNPKGRPTSNSEHIIHRLNDGYTLDDCRMVIMRMVREWQDDDKMCKYLTPETLFRRSNFEKYLGMCE